MKTFLVILLTLIPIKIHHVKVYDIVDNHALITDGEIAECIDYQSQSIGDELIYITYYNYYIVLGGQNEYNSRINETHPR